ncbi:MAG: hypothetical protein ABSB49_05190 [Polyangia bacterium]|jgi:hypothetical protein
MNAPAGKGAPAPTTAAKAPRRHVFLRGLLIIVAVLVGIAVLVRLLLDPVATRETRSTLGNLEGLAGDFEHVHVTVLPPSYTITHLKIWKIPAARQHVISAEAPLLYVDRARLALSLHELVRGHLVASLRLYRPKITAVQPPQEKVAPASAPPPPPDLSRQLARVPALQVARVEMVDGEILFLANEGGEHPRIWLHRLQMTAQNLATRREGASGRPTTTAVHGVVAHSGDLTLFVSADPLAHPLSFAGEVALRGLRATDLYQFMAAKSDIEPTHGTIDIFAEFRSEKGVISGGVKPVLKNIELRSDDEGLWARTKAWLADKAVELASDRIPGRHAVATTVPIKGELTNPDIQLWPAVLGVIRNAFVAGLESGFADLPPPSSKKKQGLLEQASQALEKNAGPPKAQPSGKHRRETR